MATNPNMPMPSSAQVSMPEQIIAPKTNVDFANDAIQGNKMFFNSNPELGAEAIQSGNQTTVNVLAATSHFTAVANALDEHVATYGSSTWIANALKNVPDIAKAIVPTPLENLTGMFNQ